MKQNDDVSLKELKDIQVEGKDSVEYKNPISFTSQFYFCGIPFRLDTYRGCSHYCKYCFANARKGFQEAHFQVGVAKKEYFERLFKKAFDESEDTNNINIECLRHRLPLHFGGMSDPFQHREKDEKISYEVLKLLRDYDYPVAISTKNVMFTEDKYFKLLRDMKVIMQVSIINNRNIPEMEPKASSVDDRFRAVKCCWDSGIPCHIRLQPFIPSFIGDEDEYIKKVRDTGCNFVSIEHLKLSVDNREVIHSISDALGYDIRKRFRGIKAKSYGRELEVSAGTKYKLLFDSGLVDKFHKNGIKLGMGDNQLHQYSDAKTCCGVDLHKGFENYFKANYTYLTSLTDKTEFTFSDLTNNHWIPKNRLDTSTENRPYSWNDSHPLKYDKDGKINKPTVKLLLKNKWIHPEKFDTLSDLYLFQYRKDGIYYKKKKQETLGQWIHKMK